MQAVAILNKEASELKSSFDFIHVRAEILNAPELERDWENIYRRFADYKHEDIKTIQTIGEGNKVAKIYNVSDRVLDAMWTLGKEDHKVSKSELYWAIDKISDGEDKFIYDQSDKTSIVFWAQHMANVMVRKINPNFMGYVSHCDEDEVVDRICNEIAFRLKTGMKRPSQRLILKYWINEDWAPIYMVAED